MTDIFVNAVSGLDANSGLTEALAVQTLHVGVTKAIALPKDDDAVVKVKGFTDPLVSYNLAAPIFLTEAANRTDTGKRFRIEAMQGPMPFVTARTRVTGWTSDDAFTISTPMAGNEVQLWADNHRLQRNSWGKDEPTFKVFQWEPGTQSCLVNGVIVPAGGFTPGLLFVVQMGWSLSYLRVTGILPNAVVGFARISFDVERVTEFAKSDGGLGLTFPIGPFHANGSFQHFWWENAAEFMPYAFGNFWHDTVAGRMRVRLPIGATSETFNATGVWRSNGNETAFIPSSTADGLYAGQIDFKDMGFKHFGWNWTASNGFIGYISGYSLFNNAGSVGFQRMPGVIDSARCKSLSVEGCLFTDITGVAVFGLYGHQGIRIENNGFKRIGSSAICFKGVVSPFDDMTPLTQNNGLVVRGNYIEGIGFSWSGSAIFTGQWYDYEIDHNTIRDCADDAIGLGDGARVRATWTGQISLCTGNDIDGVMKRTRDGGGIYSSGNQTRIRRIAISPPRAEHPQLVISGNRIKNVRESNLTDESAGNRCASIYLDLGSSQTAVYGNEITDGSLAFLENCAPFNQITENFVFAVSQLKYTAYSGYNNVSDTGGVTVTRLYLPPLNNPPNADDINRFNGTGPYATSAFGAFKDVCPFISPASCFIGATNDYETLSLFARNGPEIPINMSNVGAPPSVIARFMSA